MIIKRKSLPLKLIGIEALSRRLPANHPLAQNIEEEARRIRAGENGERILESVFTKYSFPFEHYILHDLHLQSTGRFQIDTLFISRHSAVILEMKNIAGRIEFPKDQKQLTRVLENGKIDSFECPSVQLERNMMLLNDWFYANGFSIPIKGAVVFPRPQQSFENIRKDLTVLFPNEIPVFLRKPEETSPSLDSQTLKSVASKLSFSSNEYNPFPLIKNYNLSLSELITGVRCEVCGTHGMHAIYNGWGCNQCGHSDKYAHIQAVVEYCMLVDFKLTNSEVRKFLRINSRDKVVRMLKKMGLSYSGEKRGAAYSVNLKDLEILLEKKIKLYSEMIMRRPVRN
ncbi:nuclease-related domain-containing protein [Sporosarcina sp. UB5]|uniref:nuclease-related domain-containing protein n=1 Tax=Sporosarcina sp. UB5 TaxID=3047463 RepID=UPI003D7C07FD